MTIELKRFAEAFRSEDDLRKQIAALLSRMHCQGVQITHGAQEYGKDIVFYAPDLFGDWKLHACVVKNAKLTGSVDDNDGARNVLFQVDQALDTPFINSSGMDEHVARVYVMSPYDCSQITMKSVQGKLSERAGQIEFLCGARLLEKFVQHWPEFLLFQSTLLGSYVAALQKAFDESDPISFLASQHSIFGDSGVTWRSVYVRQEFEVRLRAFDFLVEVPGIGLLEYALSYSQISEILEQINFVSEFVRHPQVWESGDADIADRLSLSLQRLITQLKEKWEQGWEKQRKESETEGTSPVPRKAARVQIPDIETLGVKELIQETRDVIESFEHAVRRANRLVDQTAKQPVILGSSEYLNYCRVREVVGLVPAAFRATPRAAVSTYPEDLLEHNRAPLLITGPAGYGKTSFCKWNALNDVQALADKTSSTIPVYVALHQLATLALTKASEAFFRTAELRELVATAKKNKQKVRLYLDGLDEVTTPERQRLLMTFGAELHRDWPEVQIVVTGRSYVSGTWLRWLSRINLSELSDAQVSVLASKWLNSDPAALSDFQNQISRARTLRPLMHIPLLGTLIIAVFKKLRSLPESKIKLYEIFVDLMCGGWDIAKNVKRDTRFGSQAKLSVLTRLAGILHLNGKREAQESDIRAAVNQTMPGLLLQWRNLLDEVLEDGLLVRLGSTFTFSHLSFQEYLVATDLADPFGSRQQHALKSFLSGDDWWREVLSFYLSMSTRPEEAENWIRRTLDKLSSGNRRYDLSQRYEFLIHSLKDSWPEWTPRYRVPEA